MNLQDMKKSMLESIRYENFIYFFPCQGGKNIIVKFDTVTEQNHIYSDQIPMEFSLIQ